ncbi:MULTISPECIES: phage virion morphogenesis protein [pseudomallei group]|uniref:Gp5, phage virion morphogenesis protein n=1 Tax=Burkholderia phage phiE255 TaxID=2883942 RepID=A4JWJ7_9CAUD|nr:MULTISPECIES: phage virion morphogenesis protein [pseudomallei group]YP_001111205.1 tail completion or Neck1 protein [Burkholderia phage phiE255]ABO60659.1 gp5, phage virion morphogenesis protein [Burkholderia phage phiE255]AIS97072.1 phage virion morphogenesis protein [Burkholderia thailandensis MSMB59]AOJ44337.1 phage morphogenesis protein [Burkholderia thailandensis]KGS44686.1 phage virion morphogenesis protein [Burkholderia pseudomallei MSHR5492]KVG08353.1 phage morphogenesis protein [
MSDFVNFQIDDSALRTRLLQLEQAGHQKADAMRKITQALVLVTEDNFAAQGRPRWQALSEATIHMRVGGKKAYKKNGELTAAASRRKAGLMILQDSGQMAASTATDSGEDYSVIGSNKEYAAIQHFGGQAGRGLKVTIPGRAWLPVTADGELQPEAVEPVLNTILRHLMDAANRR